MTTMRIGTAAIVIFIYSFCGYAQPRPNFFKRFEAHQQKQTAKTQVDPNEEVRIIVRLKQEPTVRTPKGGRTTSRLRIEDEHRQFKEELQQLVNRVPAGKSITETKIHLEYSTVFNGFAITTTRGLAEEIKKLATVNRVIDDNIVEAVDDPSNAIIGADRVWTDYGITGQGVTIGIIDTGIDYTHPAMGGGFGPGFKVIGGYDFVNNDADPIDDHNHGTHVAGIAAGNGGGLKGVAPDAKLVAYKVLDLNGFGFVSGVIAAVERTSDPDQDPLTDDALDVVNISIGAFLVENDPLVEAVNNAVDMGVVVVVAAGNFGFNFAMGSPGIAEKAITAGATDSDDNTAWFSSRGPAVVDFGLKPDIAAPGVSIYSSILNEQIGEMSGTSMAAPHVAGAVALLLDKNPIWTPEIVKAVVMQSAVNTGEAIWNQGAGRLNVYDAIAAEVVLTPGSHSLSLITEMQGEWNRTLTATIHNFSGTAKDFSFTITGEIVNPAITIRIEPANLTLLPGESEDISVVIEIPDLTSLPNRFFPNAYVGSLVALYDNKEISSAIAFFKLGVKLLSPSNNAQNLPDNLNFAWENYSDAMIYYFQLSQSPDFSNSILKSVYSTDTQVYNLRPATDYYWRAGMEVCVLSDSNFTWYCYISYTIWSDAFTFHTKDLVTGVDELHPGRFNPYCYPNPFSSSVTISFYSASSVPATVSVYSMTGQKVKTYSVYTEEGANSVVWDGTTDRGDQVSSGVFVAMIESNSVRLPVKMVLRR